MNRLRRRLLDRENGSKDILTNLKKTFEALRVVRLTRNQGQSGAFEAGIQAARGQFIVLIDADMQNDPADIGKLIAALEGPDKPACAAGRRAARQDNFIRRLSSRIANGVRISKPPTTPSATPAAV